MMAGTTAMPGRRFVAYNALGALTWAATLATIAFLTGPLGAAIVYGCGVAAAGGGTLLASARAWKRRRHERAAEASV